MKTLKIAGVLITLMGAAALAVALGPSVYGQSPERRARELTVLSGRGGEIGVRIADAAGSGSGNAAGVEIVDVEPSGAAEKAGVKKGDVVVEFDGERVRSSRQFARLVQETPPGRSVKATVMRDGQRKDVQIVAAEGPGQSGFAVDGDRPSDQLGDLNMLRDRLPFNFNFDFARPGAPSSGRLGVTVDELTRQLADYFGAKDGVLVTGVTDDSAAARAGLKAGDVITSINGRRVASRDDIVRELRDANDDEVSIGIVRDKKEIVVNARLERLRAPRRGRPA
jgi:serine protease Do